MRHPLQRGFRKAVSETKHLPRRQRRMEMLAAGDDVQLAASGVR